MSWRGGRKKHKLMVTDHPITAPPYLTIPLNIYVAAGWSPSFEIQLEDSVKSVSPTTNRFDGVTVK